MKLLLQNELIKNKSESKISRAVVTEKIAKYSSLFVSCISAVVLFGILGFVIYEAILGIQSYGFDSIFGDQFNLSAGEVSFWLPFFATIVTTFISLLIATPLGIKTAVFIKFRINKKYKKIFRVIVETLAGIPSVVFGLFCSQSFKLIYVPLGISSYSILNASVMLSFMVLPTIIAMSYNALESVDSTLLINPIALGATKTKTIYKIYKKEAKNGIVVGVILAIGRAIGETMALSMLLKSENDYSVIANGSLLELLESNIKTVSVIISTNMYGENSTPESQSLLFAFGLVLFILVMVFNLFVVFMMRNKKIRSTGKVSIFIHNLKQILFYFPNLLINGFEYLFFKTKRSAKITTINEAIVYSRKRNEEYALKNLYSWYKIFWEIICILICFTFISWLIVEIVGFGIQSWVLPSSTVFDYVSKNTTAQAFLNTLLIIFVSIIITLPFSLLGAVYLNEFNKNEKFKKTINFFLDSLGSTPSIIFGMFGLLFFIQILGLTSSGPRGFSLIAGSLTISLVILPSFTRLIQQALSEISNEIRINAYALGANTYRIVTKIILPAALKGIVTSVILVIGRILSETAPLYLTSGLTSSSYISLDRSGQTLTTRIYAQLENTNLSEATNIMYESTFLTLLLILTLIVIGYCIIPNWKSIKSNISNFINYLKYKIHCNKNLQVSK